VADILDDSADPFVICVVCADPYQPGGRKYCCAHYYFLFVLVDRAVVFHPAWNIHTQAERALLCSLKFADDAFFIADQRHVRVECIHSLARFGYFMECAG